MDCVDDERAGVDLFSTISGAAARSCLNVAALALVALAFAAAPGVAQQRAGGAATALKQSAATDAVSGPILAVASIARQRVSVYGQGDGPDGKARLITQSPVSTGMPGYRTPTGVFSVVQKRRYHESNIYSGAPMPFMQRLTWSGIALHAGVVPGFPASHGCIRLPHHFAVHLWGMTKVGTRVVVTPDDAPVLAIEHPRLPAPSLAPAPADDDRPQAMARPEARGPELTSAAGLRVTDAATDAAHELAARRTRLAGPLQRAAAVKAAVAREAVTRARAVRPAAEIAAARSAEARQGKTALHNAEMALAVAQRRLEVAARAAAAASGTPVEERPAEALAAAHKSFAEAQRLADAAWLLSAALSQEAAEAATTAAEAADLARAAADAAKSAERATEPISILVSRKAGRVFIRQGWTPIHEAPVRFLDDGPALGTHLYLATGAAEDGEAMRWLSVSLPSSVSASSHPRGRPSEPAQGALAMLRPHETAAGALARFELPEETRRFIADRLWAGATLIVSEHGPSGETGASTDFIVLTR